MLFTSQPSTLIHGKINTVLKIGRVKMYKCA